MSQGCKKLEGTDSTIPWWDMRNTNQSMLFHVCLHFYVALLLELFKKDILKNFIYYVCFFLRRALTILSQLQELNWGSPAVMLIWLQHQVLELCVQETISGREWDLRSGISWRTNVECFGPNQLTNIYNMRVCWWARNLNSSVLLLIALGCGHNFVNQLKYF